MQYSKVGTSSRTIQITYILLSIIVLSSLCVLFLPTAREVFLSPAAESLPHQNEIGGIIILLALIFLILGVLIALTVATISHYRSRRH